MLRIIAVAAMALTLLTLVMACESGGSTAGASAGGSGGNSGGSSGVASIKNLVGEWTLSKLEGADIASLLPASMRRPSLAFGSDGKVSGSTGINRLTSMIDTQALMRGEFKLAPTATTKMAGPAEAMDVESKFLSALTRAKSAKVSGNTLSLSDGARELLSFVKGK